MSKSFFDKYKDPRWQKKRLECLEASEWACQSCGEGSEQLQVHHKQYLKNRSPWEYSVGQLAVLCGPCHEYQHEGDNLLELISYLPIEGPLSRRHIAALLSGMTEAATNKNDCKHSATEKIMFCVGVSLMDEYYKRIKEHITNLKDSVTA